MTRHHKPAFTRQWGWPLALAGTTVLGLISALIGEGGVWWLFSWIALAMPLVVIAFCLLARNPRP